ncbi:MAG: plasmid stability protein [Myxococcota bacterium]|jgi:plasmid stability protein
MSDTPSDKKSEKKERVIHTRVPESLDEELRERAAKLGISVSNLVRNVLRNAFDLVEEVLVDTAGLARSARGDDPEQAPQPAPAPQPLGRMKLILERNALCTSCNGLLPRGSEAAVAITTAGASAEMICLHCLEEVVK